MTCPRRRICAISVFLCLPHGGCVSNRDADSAPTAAQTAKSLQNSVSSGTKQNPGIIQIANRAFTTAPRDLRVMSFNLRVPIFIDGPNYWNFRKGLLVETIRRFDPDLLGTQECVLSQANHLREELADYAFVGVGRNDGQLRGEMCGVFFRRDRFDKLAEGHFWLSETPDVPGSKSWGTANTRMVTWVKLRDRWDGNTFCFFNTHFDHWGRRARAQAAILLRRKVSQIAGTLPVIVTGDFNADEDSLPYQTIITGTGRGDERFTDTFRAANRAGDLSDDGTRHDFRGSRNGPRIDWIVTNSAFQTIQASIDHSGSGLRYPSDHFPVTAVIRPVASPTVARVE